MSRVGIVIFAITVALAGCGGGDDATTAASDVEANSDLSDPGTAPPTSSGSSAADTTGGGAVRTGPLPSACTLLSSASVASAIGATAAPSEHQKPTEISSSCTWSLGQPHSLSLDVRAGSNAENTFNNTIVGGFTQVPFTSAEGWIMLGARETDRDYRVVIFEAYDGVYYVHLTLQGPDRDDAPATQVVSALAEEVYAALG